MKAMLLGLAAPTVALIPIAPDASSAPGPAPIVANGARDPHAHGWYVRYRHHQGGHHVAGPFHTRHGAEDHAHRLRDRGYHIERIVRN